MWYIKFISQCFGEYKCSNLDNDCDRYRIHPYWFAYGCRIVESYKL